jgi:hypothetical protein
MKASGFEKLLNFFDKSILVCTVFNVVIIAVAIALAITILVAIGIGT